MEGERDEQRTRAKWNEKGVDGDWIDTRYDVRNQQGTEKEQEEEAEVGEWQDWWKGRLRR